jgi:hypothetical protein
MVVVAQKEEVRVWVRGREERDSSGSRNLIQNYNLV